MAYGKKYNYYFQYGYTTGTDEYEVAFYVKDYASSVTLLQSGDLPLTIKYQGQRDDESVIQISDIRLNFKVDQANIAAVDADFLETQFGDMIIKIISDPNGTPVTIWTGINDPSNSYREWQGYIYMFSVWAIDGLRELRNIPFNSNGTEYGAAYSGFANFLTIIKNAISKVATMTELQHGFKVQLGTYSNLMTSSECALKECEIVYDVFSEEQSGKTNFDTCYDVLEKILKNFYCTLKVHNGYYWIINTAEPDSYVFTYDWATLTQQSRSASDLTVDISDDKYLGTGNLYKYNPIVTSKITLYNKYYTTTLLTNGGFDSNITGWTNGDADDNSNQWTANFNWYDYPYIGGVLKAEKGGSPTSGNYNLHSTSMTLVVGASAPWVDVSYKLEFNYDVPGDLVNMPRVRARLYNATNGYLSGVMGWRDITTVGGFYSFSDSFNVTSLSVTGNYLDFEIEVRDTDNTACAFYFDNVVVSQDNTTSLDPKDWDYYGGVYAGYNGIKVEDTMYFAEYQESVNDICSIKDAGGSHVTSWSRYGETSEGLRLIPLIQMQQLIHRQRWCNYVKCTLYDNTNKISNINFLIDGAKTYKIIGYEKNYKQASVSLDMVELANDSTSISSNRYKQAAAYGD